MNSILALLVVGAVTFPAPNATIGATSIFEGVKSVFIDTGSELRLDGEVAVQMKRAAPSLRIVTSRDEADIILRVTPERGKSATIRQTQRTGETSVQGSWRTSSATISGGASSSRNAPLVRNQIVRTPTEATISFVVAYVHRPGQISQEQIVYRGLRGGFVAAELANAFVAAYDRANP